MNQSKSVIIIGGGISGLTAGIYAEQCGMHAIILEKNPSVGGFCTGWYRSGMYIDGCIHWLTGTNENTILSSIWKNVGAFTSQDDIIYLPCWGTFEYQGKKVSFYRDLERAESSWIALAPEDKKEIIHFFNMVHALGNIELPIGDSFSIRQYMRLGLDLLLASPDYFKNMMMSCEKYAKKFKNPALRWALSHAQPGPGNLYSLIYSYATVAFNNGGIPIGGSKPMVERMKDRFLSLGGTLLLNSEVASIDIHKKKIKQVKLKNGRIYFADYYVMATDANYALNNLLPFSSSISKFNKRFNKPHKYVTPSCCLVSLKMKDLNIPSPYNFEVEPFYIGDEIITSISLRQFNYDNKTYLKDGYITTQVLLDQYSNTFDYWQKLSKNPVDYQKYKKHIADLIIGKIVKKFPSCKGDIACLDVATPLTMRRYTNAPRGEYMSFLFRPFSKLVCHNGKVPGINNLFLAGQWMFSPGGLPLALVNGKKAIEMICRKEKLRIGVKSSKKAYAKS